MGVPINNVSRRVVYAASGTGPYAFTFEILAAADIAVYKDDTLLTLTTDYTVTINANGTGSITLTASPTGATQIAIVGNRTIQRLTDFVTGGDLFANTINDELDQQTIFAQQNAEGLDRSLKAPQTDPTSINMTLPRASVRANKTLAFDANGNPTTGEVIGDNRGNWAAGTAYNKRDIVKDTSNGNIYYANTAHTSSGSQPISSNADSAKWDLIVDNAAAGASASAAAASASAAASSASAASTSASNASSSASSAASSASAASTSASNASTSATNAASSASTASTQASNAATSATNAANSATSASNSASTATTQATNASNSASSASTSATNAANSASSASSSASSASSSASSASTSASNAASSATAAAASATSAAASYDSFDDRYLGAKTSDPTLDNDGNALLTGALYFNSSTGEMKVYSGSAWVSSFLTTGAQTITGVKTFASNPILSAGTANGVAYLNGSKVLTTGSALTFDGANSFLGIGPGVTPSKSLTIYNPSIDTEIRLQTSTKNFYLSQRNSSGQVDYIVVDNAAQTWSVNNSEQMRLTSTGLGIGTSSPARLLDVSGSSANIARFTSSATSTSVSLDNTNASGWGSNIGFFTGGVNSGYFGTIGSLLGNTTQDLAAYANTGNGFRVYTNGNNLRAIVTSAGDVGIGTSSPAYKLDVSSASTPVARFTGSANAYVDFSDGTVTSRLQNSGALLFGTTSNHSLLLRTNSTTQATLDTSGNLGLGVTPSAWANWRALDINTTTSIFGGYSGSTFGNGVYATSDTSYLYKNTGIAPTMYQQGGGQHRWYYAASGTAGTAISFTQAMTLDAGGNLLLGQTSQDARFNLNGPSTSTSNPQIRIRNSADGSGNSHLDIGYYYQSGVGEYGFIQSFTDYGSAPRDLLLQPRGGNVGIGTSSPGQLLDVSKSQNTDTVVRVVNSSSGTSAAAQFYASNGTTQTQFFHLGTAYSGSGVLATAGTGGVYSNNAPGLAFIAANASAPIMFATGGTTERFRVTSSGEILIGKTSTSNAVQGLALYPDGQMRMTTDGTASNTIIGFFRNSSATLVGSITTTSTATAYNTSSDYRLKDNPQPLTGSGAFIDALKPKTWVWKADGSKGVGFIAHEVQEVSPASVTGEKDGEQMQAMEYGSAEFIANIIAELQSLRARVAQLEAK